jgi:hypothetical protein
MSGLKTRSVLLLYFSTLHPNLELYLLYLGFVSTTILLFEFWSISIQLRHRVKS